jgi:hypothetical protein
MPSSERRGGAWDGLGRLGTAWDGLGPLAAAWPEPSRCSSWVRVWFMSSGPPALAVGDLPRALKRTFRRPRTHLAPSSAPLPWPSLAPRRVRAHHARRTLPAAAGRPPHLRLACDGLLETVGRVTLGGWGPRSFTAHPKFDPVTGVI